LIKSRNHPEVYLQADLKMFDLGTLGKFDVILMDPPWEEYSKRIARHQIYQSETKFTPWTFEEISALAIEDLASIPSFLFLWCGSTHLDDGRALFKQWGFKRCEDIVWAKTNRSKKGKI